MDSERELEVIRDEMEQTRTSLADKLGALESQVRETVSTASDTVNSTVEGVKDVVTGVSETVGSVTDTLNVSKHVEEHPWAAMGIAVAAGFLASRMFGGSAQQVVIHAPPQPAPQPQPTDRPQPQPAQGGDWYHKQQHQQPERQHQQPERQHQPHQQDGPKGPSLAEQAAAVLPALSAFIPDLGAKAKDFLPSMDTLVPEIEKLGNTVATGLGGLAVGSVMSVVRGLAVDALPDSWKGEIVKIVDDLTEQLGGKPAGAKGQEKPGQNGHQQQPGQEGQKHEGQGGQKHEGQEGQEKKDGPQQGWREARNQLVGQS